MDQSVTQPCSSSVMKPSESSDPGSPLTYLYVCGWYARMRAYLSKILMSCEAHFLQGVFSIFNQTRLKNLAQEEPVVNMRRSVTTRSCPHESFTLLYGS